MNDNIVPSLKLVYKPLIMYYGEWELLDGLEELSLENNKKNMFKAFLERYYYMPLKVIFKDEDLARSFKYVICSRLGDSGRTLYFSKVAFLRNVITNANEIVSKEGDIVYKEIKKAIRERKDIYRDVDKLGEHSIYYNDVLKEYEDCELEISFLEFVLLCKRKYTKLLTGYNAVLDLFDKAINVDKFIECFDPNRLYLFTCYSLLKHSEKYLEEHGKLDYNIVALDTYRSLVDELREKDKMYNSHIIINNEIYTIDDLFREYDELVKNVNEK